MYTNYVVKVMHQPITAALLLAPSTLFIYVHHTHDAANLSQPYSTLAQDCGHTVEYQAPTQ